MADIAGIMLGPLVQDLNSLIQREVRLVCRVKADLRSLSSSLKAIQAVLADAEEQQIKSKEVQKRKAVRDWLMKLQDAAYDAQDILEDWAVADEEGRRQFNAAATRMNRVRKSLLSFHYLKKRLLFRYKIARQVKEIRGRFDQIAKDKSDFHLKGGEVVDVDGVIYTHHTIDSTRETSSFSKEPQIYGRDDDRENIVKMLLENRNMGHGIAVCSIYGIGGLGKTTLAQLVFNDHRVQKHFDVKIWLCVSDPFNGKRLLKEIVEKVTKSGFDHDNLDMVQDKVKEVVRGKKFLLVLDDVWSENPDDINMLKNPLNSAAEGSSIVVTTRKEKVASITKSILKPYKLDSLSEVHCWSLFRSYAFDGKEKPHLETIGREILKKCGGLPLAAKALGSLLRFKNEKEQWEQIRDSEIWKLEEEDEILPALRLSYYNLSARARQCFAYCSFFPKDYRMKKEEIVLLWWASGLLQNKTMGKNVFNQLKLHSFFQNMEEDEEDENEITFKIHDLLHDLAYSVMKKEHLYIAVEVGRNATHDIQDDEIRPRHMLIIMSPSSQSSSVEVSYLHSHPSHHRDLLRTLFLFSNHYEGLKLTSQDVSIIAGLKYLRVFRIGKSCILEELPASFGKKLKHLRMLILSGCGLSSLQAESFCGMRNLQFLDLSYNSMLKALPHLMGQNLEKVMLLSLFECDLSSLQAEFFYGMRNLQILNLGCNYSMRMLPNAMGKYLEDLRHLNLSKCGLLSLQAESFRGMKKLETLDLSHNDDLQTLPNSIGKCLESLRQLNLNRCTSLLLLHDEVFSGMRNLELLDLSGCWKLESLPDSIGDLEKLRHLDLSKNRNLKTLPESLGNLTKLETLKLSQCYDLTLLPQNTCKLCSLKRLENDCSSLKSMPSGIGQHLTKLEKLSMWACGIGEIDNIKNLRALHLLSGSLEIKITDEGEAHDLHWEEGEEDVLTNKTNLSLLRIMFWHRDGRIDEQLLRVLKPPSNIEDLVICSYKGTRFPDWMLMRDPNSSFPRLRSIELYYLRHAEESWLQWREECLPALQHLKISDFQSLKALPEALKNLTSLKSLMISGCHALVSAPTVLHELTSLESLDINFCKELMSLPQQLQLMTSLKALMIWDCPKLKFTFHGLQHLTSLQKLSCGQCPGVVIPKKELETLVALRDSNLFWWVDEELIIDDEPTTSESGLLA